MFIHCTAAIRVGAFWMIRRVLRDGFTPEAALEEARKVGLVPTPHLEEFARTYIESAASPRRPGDAGCSFDSLEKSYGQTVALRGVTFDVPAGEIFGLLGPNGAGKSTLIRVLMDIIRPDAGTVRVFGEPRRREHLDRLGYLPEERGLYTKLTRDRRADVLRRAQGPRARRRSAAGARVAGARRTAARRDLEGRSPEQGHVAEGADSRRAALPTRSSASSTSRRPVSIR